MANFGFRRRLDRMNPEQQPRLESWKEIAAYLQRDVKTAHRWEKAEGLPVHRHSHKSRSSVYAYPAEIDAWRAGRKVAPEPVVIPLWKKPAFAATMLMSLVMAGGAVRPQAAEAQGQTRTQMCGGSDCEGKVASSSGKLVRSPQIAGPRIDGPLYFSPDGSQVMTHRRPTPNTQEVWEVVLAKADGASPRTVYRDASGLDWSQDGKRLLIADGAGPMEDSHLLWFDIASGSIQKNPKAYIDVMEAKVSPDGKYIAFNAIKDKEKDTYSNISIIGSDWSGETVVAPSTAYQEPLGWSPDGKYVIYAQWGAALTVWSVAVSNGKVTGAPFKAAELPKDAKIIRVTRTGGLFYSATSSGSDLYTVSLDPRTGKVSGEKVPVPVSDEHVGASVRARWAPDSKQLVYMRMAPRELYLLSFETGKVQRIASTARVSSAEFCWSQDGSSFFLNDKGKAVRLDLKANQLTPLLGAGQLRLATCGGGVLLTRAENGIDGWKGGVRTPLFRVQPGSDYNSPRISHDGKMVVFMTTVAGVSTLHVVSSEGGALRDLVTEKAPAQLQGFFGYAWSADDRYVYFLRRANEKSPYELMRVPAAGGAAEPVGLEGEDLRELDMAPDGKRLVFSVGAVNRPEIWELKGFLPKR
jgi:Tol biopolymer transport system component